MSPVATHAIARTLSAQSHHRIAKRIEEIFCKYLALSPQDAVEVLAEGAQEGEKTVIKTKEGVRKLWIRHLGGTIELLIQFGEDDAASMVDEYRLFAEHDHAAQNRYRLPVVLDYPCGRKIPAHRPDEADEEAETVALHEKIEEAAQQGE